MDRREPPPTEEGWFVLHDFRTIDWDAWTAASELERSQAVMDGKRFFERAEAVEDADAGQSVTYSVLGHKADILSVHIRPTLEALQTIERRFEQTDLARFTEHVDSYVSVTEVSGYTSREFFEEGDMEDAGLSNYFQMRLYPRVPDAQYVCFYPMSKRRGPEHNWYALPFEDRADYMASHGEIGREYGGKITQMITGSIGFDDWEWGVTLWGNDPVQFKRLLYEMRFDPSTSLFAEFGSFAIGTRLPPQDLVAFLAGDPLGTDGGSGASDQEAPSGRESDAAPSEGGNEKDAGSGIRSELAELGIYAGQPHGEDVFALVMYSTSDAESVFDEVTELRSNFDHYDTHIKTAVYESEQADPVAIVSIWETERAAQTAGGFLADIMGVAEQDETADGFGTMGMFYTVKSEHRDEFLDTFDDVVDVLESMEGHRKTAVFANREAPNDMFIDSRWRSKDDAMSFFRSEAFRDTVSWGRDILDDRPRHVFLA